MPRVSYQAKVYTLLNTQVSAAVHWPLRPKTATLYIIKLTFSGEGSSKVVVEVERIFDGNAVIVPEFL